MMFSSVFLLLFMVSIEPIASQYVKNETFEAFRVCSNQAVQMYMWRNYGENLWNGSVETFQWTQLSSFMLILDAPARIEMKKAEFEYLVMAENGNRSFHIYNINRSLGKEEMELELLEIYMSTVYAWILKTLTRHHTCRVWKFVSTRPIHSTAHYDFSYRQ